MRLRLLFCELCCYDSIDRSLTNDYLIEDNEVIEINIVIKVSICTSGVACSTGDEVVVESKCIIHVSSNLVTVNIEELVDLNSNDIAGSIIEVNLIVLLIEIISNDINVSYFESSLGCSGIDYHECELNEVFAAIDLCVVCSVCSKLNNTGSSIVMELESVSELRANVLSTDELNNVFVVIYGVVETPNISVEGISRNNNFNSSTYTVGTLSSIYIVLYAVKCVSPNFLNVAAVRANGLSVTLVNVGSRNRFNWNRIVVSRTGLVDQVFGNDSVIAAGLETELNPVTVINACGINVLVVKLVRIVNVFATDCTVAITLNDVGAAFGKLFAIGVYMTVGAGCVSIDVLITAKFALEVLVEIIEAIYRAEFAINDDTFLSIVVKKEDHELTVEHVLEHGDLIGLITGDITLLILKNSNLSSIYENFAASLTVGVTLVTDLTTGRIDLTNNYFVVAESLKIFAGYKEIVPNNSSKGNFFKLSVSCKELSEILVEVALKAILTLPILNTTGGGACGSNCRVLLKRTMGSLNYSVLKFDGVGLAVLIICEETANIALIVFDVAIYIALLRSSVMLYYIIMSCCGNSYVDTCAAIVTVEGFVSIADASGSLIDVSGSEARISMNIFLKGSVFIIFEDMLSVNCKYIFNSVKYGGERSLESVYAAVYNVAANLALLPLVNVAACVVTVTVGNLLGYNVVVSCCFKNKLLGSFAILTLSDYVAVIETISSLTLYRIVEDNVAIFYVVVIMSLSFSLDRLRYPLTCWAVVDFKTLCFASRSLDNFDLAICVVIRIEIFKISSLENVNVDLIAGELTINDLVDPLTLAVLYFAVFAFVMPLSCTVCNGVALGYASRGKCNGNFYMTLSRLGLILYDYGNTAVLTAPNLKAVGGTRSGILCDLLEVAVNNVLVSVLFATNAALNVTIAYFNGVIIVAGHGEIVTVGLTNEVFLALACLIDSLSAGGCICLSYALIERIAERALVNCIVAIIIAIRVLSFYDKIVIAIMLVENYNLLGVATLYASVFSKTVDTFDFHASAIKLREAGLIEDVRGMSIPLVIMCFFGIGIATNGTLVNLLYCAAESGFRNELIRMLRLNLLFLGSSADRAGIVLHTVLSFGTAYGFNILFGIFYPLVVSIGTLYEIVKVLRVTGQTLINSVAPFVTLCINCFNSYCITVFSIVCFVNSGTLQFVSRKDRRRNERQNHDRCQENRKKLLHVFFLSKK